MLACTRCGRWHSDAEDAMKKRLSCSEVKQYWIGVKRAHRRLYGHMAKITTDESGRWICYTCQRRLGIGKCLAEPSPE